MFLVLLNGRSRLLVSAPTPSVPAFTPTPTCPPVDLRSMAGCERRSKRRLPPTQSKEASLRQRPDGVSIGVCCRCNGSGNVRDVCVWSAGNHVPTVCLAAGATVRIMGTHRARARFP